MSSHRAIAIGGSTGSIPVLKKILSKLPTDINAPVFVVVHVGTMGRDLMAGAFSVETSLPVTTAQDGELALPGNVYVAPADHHLLIIDDYIRLGRGPRENLSRPALDPLFRSVAVTYGSGAIGVVLSGMLDDGGSGLAAIKQCGGVTIVQNPAEAEAPEMLMNALAASDIDYRASSSDIAQLLKYLVDESYGSQAATAPDIMLEVDIALGRPCLSPTIAEIAQPVALTCPACSGALSEINQPPLRFRCQVGHGYSAKSLAAEQVGSLDEAVRIALRIVEERAHLAERMARQAKQSGRHYAAEDSIRKAAEFRQYANILRSAALDGLPNVR